MTKGSYEASKRYQFQLLQNETWARYKNIQKWATRWTRSVWLLLLICIGLLNHFIYVLSFKSPCALYMLYAPKESQITAYSTHSAHRTKLYEKTLNMEITYEVWNDEWAREYVRIVLFSLRSKAQNNWSVVRL